MIKEQAISYLKQKHPNKTKQIELLINLRERYDNTTNFDEYIDKWIKELLSENIRDK